MKIIFISKDSFQKEIIRNCLDQLSEQDSIVFFHSYAEAEDFIANHIIADQVPIDLIITQNNIQLQKANEFLERIRKDKLRTFSNYDFNFHSVPVVLIVDEDENKNAFTGFGFSDVITNVGIEKLHLFIQEFNSSVKSWRKQVLDELDNLGIRYNSGNIDYSYFLSPAQKKNIDTKILSENFKLFPRKLSYEWLSFNERQIEKAIDLFIKELKRADRLNKKKDEKRFHELFNKYPFFIKRDNYSKHWHEPHLYYEENKYFEPDFGLKPNFRQRTDLSILEIKLPNEGFIKKTRFHPSPYSNLMKHIFQVNDYKDYLESDEYKTTIEKVFGVIPSSIEYNILIGRLNDKNSNIKMLNKRMRQMNAMYINLITYDELLDYQVKYLERLQVLKIL